MKKIIAVCGKSNYGKTETLNILIDLLSCVIYDYKIEKYNEWTNDRRAVFTVGKIKVFICTAGDNEEEAKNNINFIKKEKEGMVENVVFTACHSGKAINRRVLKQFANQNGYEFIEDPKHDDTQESRRLATKFFIQVMQQAEEQSD